MALSLDHEIYRAMNNPFQEDEEWRRKCGCLRTSEKLKQVLASFPAPPPPSPSTNYVVPQSMAKNCISAYCTRIHQPSPLQEVPKLESFKSLKDVEESPKVESSKSWKIVTELVQLVQLSVTATALALYYLIFCYMQLVYYTLRSALYFHNADGPMKVTIGVVTVTSLIVAFNLILKLEHLIGIF